MISREEQDRDREATWRAIGIDPEVAERENCFLAPSVGARLIKERDMFERAFLVGAVNIADGTFMGFGLFSEETPTVPSRVFLFTALRGRGNNYEEAVCDIGRLLASPSYVWMIKRTDPQRSLACIREVQRRHGVPVLP